jgi:hypothetical protein
MSFASDRAQVQNAPESLELCLTGKEPLMNRWAYQSANEMARGIRERRVGCAELLDLHLERVRRYNPALNAIIVLDADRARARAHEADAAIARPCSRRSQKDSCRRRAMGEAAAGTHGLSCRLIAATEG